MPKEYPDSKILLRELSADLDTFFVELQNFCTTFVGAGVGSAAIICNRIAFLSLSLSLSLTLFMAAAFILDRRTALSLRDRNSDYFGLLFIILFLFVVWMSWINKQTLIIHLKKPLHFLIFYVLSLFFGIMDFMCKNCLDFCRLKLQIPWVFFFGKSSEDSTFILCF